MTASEALRMVQRVGTVERQGDNLRLKFPGTAAAELQPALYTLRRCKQEAIALLSVPETPVEGELANPTANGVATPTASLKGHAVELWRDDKRFFLVADDEDAQEAMRRFGANHGEVWTSGELELVVTIPDQPVRDEVEVWKRQFDGSLSPSEPGRYVSAAECQAQMLNRLFEEQGARGEPGRITAETVRHGERKAGHK